MNYFLESAMTEPNAIMMLGLIILALGFVFIGIKTEQGIWHLASGITFFFLAGFIDSGMMSTLFVILGMLQIGVGFLRYRSVV